MGRKLIRRKLWTQAEEFYKEALKSYPDNPLFLERLGIINRELGKETESEQVFARLIDAYPYTVRYYFDMARTLLEFGRQSEAREWLVRALSQAPHSSRVLSELARIHSESGEWNQAKLYYARSFSRKRPSHGTLVTYLNACVRYKDWDAVKSLKCPREYKDFYLLHNIEHGPVRDMLFGSLPNYSDAYVADISRNPALCLAMNSIRPLDFASRHVSVSNNKRVTVGVPEKFDKSVHMLGACQTYGLYCEDRHTLPSFLQELYNNEGRNVRVVNHGVPDQYYSNQILQLFNINLAEGDDVVVIPWVNTGTYLNRSFVCDIESLKEMRCICEARGARLHIALMPSLLRIENPTEREKSLLFARIGSMNFAAARKVARKRLAEQRRLLRENNFSFCELDSVIVRPPEGGEVLVDADHLTWKAFKNAAILIHSCLSFDVDEADPFERTDTLEAIKAKAVNYLAQMTKQRYASNQELRQWLTGVKISRFGGVIGAIVCNCNPFTLGHHHLIKSAARLVDNLYVFVVQEDSSAFPFSERFRLVQEGVHDLGEKVHVIPSGQFIISSFSFPDYFVKEERVAVSDSTADVAIFGSIIAPALGISKRFVGEEPNCQTSNEYNETMKFLLPDMGVDIRVIPRICLGDAPISASRVRRYLAEGNFEEMRKLVPESTYRFLVSKFRFSRESGRVYSNTSK